MFDTEPWQKFTLLYFFTLGDLFLYKLKKNCNSSKWALNRALEKNVAGNYGEKWLWISRVNIKYKTKVWFFFGQFKHDTDNNM